MMVGIDSSDDDDCFSDLPRWTQPVPRANTKSNKKPGTRKTPSLAASLVEMEMEEGTDPKFRERRTAAFVVDHPGAENSIKISPEVQAWLHARNFAVENLASAVLAETLQQQQQVEYKDGVC